MSGVLHAFGGIPGSEVGVFKMESHYSEKQIDEATRWVLRHEEGLSDLQKSEFEAWKMENPDNENCFFEYQMDWTGLDTVRFWKPQLSETPNPDLFVEHSSNKRQYWIPAFAIAACLLIGFAVLQITSSSSPSSPSTTTVQMESYEGGKKHFLKDGSSFYLREGSQISVSFTNQSRNLFLPKGEAIFEVAKDKNRPFIVKTENAEVVAVGTIFSVNSSQDFCEVYVTEGRVKFNEKNRDPNEQNQNSNLIAEIDAGQMLNFPAHKGAFAPRIQAFEYEEFVQKTNWTNQIIEMVSAPLFEIIEEFNKYNDLHIYIPDEELKTIRMSVSVTPDNETEFLNLLEMTLNVRLERNASGIYILPQD